MEGQRQKPQEYVHLYTQAEHHGAYGEQRRLFPADHAGILAFKLLLERPRRWIGIFQRNIDTIAFCKSFTGR